MIEPGRRLNLHTQSPAVTERSVTMRQSRRLCQAITVRNSTAQAALPE